MQKIPQIAEDRIPSSLICHGAAQSSQSECHGELTGNPSPSGSNN